MDDALDRTEKMAYDLANGSYVKVLTHHGRVIYKQDPELLALGFEGHEAYLRDEFGDPVPETVNEVDPDMTRFVLKARRRDKWGDRTDVDVTVRGGVLVVGAVAKTSAELTQMAAEAVEHPAEVEFRDDDGEV